MNLHKHFIFIHCLASFTLTLVPKGLGARVILFKFLMMTCCLMSSDVS